MVRFMKSALTTAAAAALLAGCASTSVELQTQDTKKLAQDLREVSERPAAPADVAQVQIKRDVYLGADVVRNDHGDPLPAKWDRESIQIARGTAATFQDIASAITNSTGIPVAVAASTGAENGAQPTGERVGEVVNPQGPGGGDLGAAVASLRAIPVFNGGSDLGIPGQMRLSYSGKLVGLLDLVSANFNVGWEYRDGRLVFSRTIVKTFDVPALPIIAKLTFRMQSKAEATAASGAGASASSSGSGEQTAETTGGFDLWSDLQKTLTAIVGSSGTFNMSAQTGQVTVNAPPSTVNRMSDYLKTLNAQLSKQIAMSVKVYSVKLTDGDTYQSDMNLLFSKAGKYGLQLATPGGAGLTPFDPSPIGAGAPLQGGGWAILNPNSKLAGSSGIVNALAERGDVSVVTSASVTALNGVPVPVQVAQTRGYLARVEVTNTSETSSTSLEPGSVTTGFNLHLVPKIMKDGALLLQYGMNISELVGSVNGFEVFSSGGNTIQLPNVTQRNFIQQAIIPNGSTLVLAGFEQVRASNRKSGNLHAGLWPFGGTRVSNMEREILVIAITPTLLDMQRAVNRTTAALQ